MYVFLERDEKKKYLGTLLTKSHILNFSMKAYAVTAVPSQ